VGNRLSLDICGLEAGDCGVVRKAMEGAVAGLGCRLLGAEVCGIGENESRALNRRYRSMDRPASVLSFSLPPSEPGGVIGQVLLCPGAVRRAARRMGYPYRRWLAELSVHGFLHLLGYRHDDGDSRALMFAHQKALLRRSGLR
jgi:rRNA maturation RNase YbeY